MFSVTMLTGRLGSDPDLKKKGDNCMCRFSVATETYFTDDRGQQKTATEWHKIVAFNRNAVNCSKYLKSGSLVQITGHNKTRTYGPNNDKRYITEVCVDQILFLSKPANNSQE